MTQEITKNLICILTRDGNETWIDESKFEELIELVETKKFLRIEGKLINTADISGVYPAKDMEERWYRKNGYWKCKAGNYWHKPHEECGHR